MKERNARDYTSELQRAVEGKRVSFTQSHFKRYAREFKTAINLDKIEHPTLSKAIPYIAEFWDEQQLTVQKAVGGVQSREPAKQTAADRTRDYEYLFALTPRQEAMMRLVEVKGKDEVIRMALDYPEELQRYLEEKVKEKA